MLESNVGEVGLESIRIGGQRVSQLSIVDQMRARKQIVLSEKDRRRKEIRDRYPPYRVPNLEAGIREAESNIARFEQAISKERETVREFTSFLALCRQRDSELKAAGFDV